MSQQVFPGRLSRTTISLCRRSMVTRMRRLILILPLCFAALVAPAARAQAPGEADTRQPPGVVASSRLAAPLPQKLVPPAVEQAGAWEMEAPDADAARRSGWTYPLIGAGVGILAGAAYGTWVMLDSEEWLAPPIHIVTVPAGAILGLAIGGAMNLLDPR